MQLELEVAIRKCEQLQEDNTNMRTHVQSTSHTRVQQEREWQQQEQEWQQQEREWQQRERDWQQQGHKWQQQEQEWQQREHKRQQQEQEWKQRERDWQQLLDSTRSALDIAHSEMTALVAVCHPTFLICTSNHNSRVNQYSKQNEIL